VDSSRKSGIYINSCDNNTIFGNNVENNLDYGVEIDDSDDVNIIGNRFQANTDGCISTQSSLNTKEEWNVCDYVIDPFIIDELGSGNFTWDQISQFAWCSGDGSYSNPYSIASVVVDAQSVGSCIRIENSYTNYFIIDGCLTMNAQATGGEAGIVLDSVHNGTIFNCEIVDNYLGIYLSQSENITIKGNSIDENTGQGIVLYQSKNNQIIDNEQGVSSYYGLFLNAGSNNNSISDNIFQENTGAATHGDGIRIKDSESNNITENFLMYNDKGIRIEDSSNYNRVINNTILNNTVYGALIAANTRESLNNHFSLNIFDNPSALNAYDNGTGTTWDDGAIGNYWSDYGGVDANDDGIGDSPHSLPGTGGGVDNFPIWDDGVDIVPEIPPTIPFGFFFIIIGAFSMAFLLRSVKYKLKKKI
jgi:parallel beta-helix repeat protein